MDNSNRHNYRLIHLGRCMVSKNRLYNDYTVNIYINGFHVRERHNFNWVFKKMINVKYILTLILMVLFLACKPIKEIEYRDSIKVEFRDRLRVDSVLSTIKDSIYVNGDTIKIYRDRWRDRLVLRSDTVLKEIKVIDVQKSVEIERLSIWDWVKAMFIGAIIYGIISLVVKYWVKITTMFKF